MNTNYTPAQLRAMRKEDLRALTEGLWEQYQQLKGQAATPPSMAAEPLTPVAQLPRDVRKTVARFDAMTDSEQVASLKEVWGCADDAKR